MIIAVDFDGTCVEHMYPKLGKDVPGAVDALKKLVAAGHQLILYTMRSGLQQRDAEAWFKRKGISLYAVQKNPEQYEWTSSPKCYAHVYIDDAAVGAPLMRPPGFVRKCIDWEAVLAWFAKAK
jgi:hypothetical protein